MRDSFRKVLADQRDLLLFRPFRPDLGNHANLYLGWGLFTSWLVGVGRYWDHPKAWWWQYLGLGSVAYVFILALILWVIILPLNAKNWAYRNVLIFVTLTSLPAILYAIPVEQFMGRNAAASFNMAFLLVVASWRVALLVRYLRLSAGLSGSRIVIAALLPLALIVSVLTMLNLEHAVFEIMGGLRDVDRTQFDGVYAFQFMVSALGILATPVLLGSYLYAIIQAQKLKKIAENLVK